MTARFVGPGGSDANNGTTWATRKLTLNGAEDTPVVAGDIVYVAPGVYRESLTCDVAGTVGSEIVYIADIDGSHTDGVGGVVRVTGSDDDLSATRGSCFSVGARNYRTFRGFTCDTASGGIFTCSGAGTNVIIEDCIIRHGTSQGIFISGAGQASFTIRRCIIEYCAGFGIQFTHTATVSNAGHVVENCIILNANTRGIYDERIGGITVRNCWLSGNTAGAQVAIALAGGQTLTVNNCIITNCSTGVVATVAGELVEDYNTFWANGSNRSNVNTGTNSVTYPPLLEPPLLLAGFKYPQPPAMALSQWSQVRAKAGTGEASDDRLGMARPATSSKKSWGPAQFADGARSASFAYAGAASLVLADAGRIQFLVPIRNVPTTFSVQVYRGADYAGTAPQLVVKQPGQSDTTVTDASAAGQWNPLSTTITPATLPGYVVVELVSSNTATSGSFGTYFDNLSVT